MQIKVFGELFFTHIIFKNPKALEVLKMCWKERLFKSWRRTHCYPHPCAAKFPKVGVRNRFVWHQESRGHVTNSGKLTELRRHSRGFKLTTCWLCACVNSTTFPALSGKAHACLGEWGSLCVLTAVNPPFSRHITEVALWPDALYVLVWDATESTEISTRKSMLDSHFCHSLAVWLNFSFLTQISGKIRSSSQDFCPS